MLGRLSRWLRLLGYDARMLALPPARVPPGAALLTRRRSLAGRQGVVLVEADRLEDQLAQALAQLDLRPDPALFFSRCLDCNLPVEPLARELARDMVPEHTLHNAQSFSRCPGCGKVFWPGSHGQRAALLWLRMAGSARELDQPQSSQSPWPR